MAIISPRACEQEPASQADEKGKMLRTVSELWPTLSSVSPPAMANALEEGDLEYIAGGFLPDPLQVTSCVWWFDVDVADSSLRERPISPKRWSEHSTGSQQLLFKFLFSHQLPLWPWASCVTSLPVLPILEMGVSLLPVLSHRGAVGISCNVCEVLYKG